MAVRVTLPVSLDVEVVSEHLLIASDTVGVSLALRNKRRADMRRFSPEQTVILVHGATFSSVSLFDVTVGGISFMEALAQAGFDVWTVDVRGFGGSTRPSEMEAAPELNEPIAPATKAVADLSAAVEFIGRHRNVPRMKLLGFSWGGSIAGAYASVNHGRVGRLVLVAPLWLSDSPMRIDPGLPIGAYRFADVRAYEAAWRIQAPEAKQAKLIPEGWFDVWAEATLATDTSSRRPGSVRAPSGAIRDVREFWTAGRKLYEPSDIACPVLLVRGEWDIDVNHDMATSFFAELKGAPYKRRIEIGEATHMLLLEKNRRQAIAAIIAFLGETFSPET